MKVIRKIEILIDGRNKYGVSLQTDLDPEEIVAKLHTTLMQSNQVEAQVGMPSELLPCPFCGGGANIGTTKIFGDEAKLNNRDVGYFVNCKVCGANNNILHLGYATEEIAKHYWNKRASQ